MTLRSRTALRRPSRVSHPWKCAHHQPPVAYSSPVTFLRQQEPPSISHLFGSLQPRGRIQRRKKYGPQFHPPETTAASGNCLLPPPARGLLKQNPDKIGRSIQAVLKAVSAPTRFWERGVRCFAVRLWVWERQDEVAAFFGGYSLALRSKAGFENGVPETFMPSGAARGYRRDGLRSRRRWRLEVIGS